MSNNKVSSKPCPICRQVMFIIGQSPKGEKLTSCGHKFSFKKTKSEKDIERKYVRMPWGLELAKDNGS